MSAAATRMPPIPSLWGECGYCKEAGEEERLWPVEDLRFNGEHWCCSDCSGDTEHDLWEASPRLELALVAPASSVPSMPETDKRTPLGDEDPEGYLESNRDWADRNNEAVEWLIENQDAIRVAISK